jgi:hypothetical protein
MSLEPLKIVKRWFTNNQADELDWDEIADKTSSWALRTNNNLKQLGLDINGDSYVFNNVGKATQTASIVTRLDAVDNAQRVVLVRNLGIDTSVPNFIRLVGSNGSDLSSTNVGFVSFNSTSSPGQLVTRQITSTLSLELTGTHWGLDTLGDVSDVILTVMLIDDGTNAVLGVAAQAGRTEITAAVSETVAASVDDSTKVYTSSTISSTSSVVEMARVKADFDDTGNAGGENYWTVQTAIGDIIIGNPLIINTPKVPIVFTTNGPINSLFDTFDGWHRFTEATDLDTLVISANEQGSSGTTTVAIERWSGGPSGTATVTGTLASSGGVATSRVTVAMSVVDGDMIRAKYTTLATGLEDVRVEVF